MNELPFKSPLVVGYKGEIGKFILQGLLNITPKASNIWCFDINDTEKERLDRIKKSDIIFLCVPLEETKKWLNKYKDKLKGKKVFEQTSLKEWITNKILKDINLYSMHILFRPSATPNKEDRLVLVIQSKKLSSPIRKWDIEIERMIEAITNSQIQSLEDYYTHDILMAYQQALLHRIVLTLDKTLSSLYGKTFMAKRVRELAERIKGGNKNLYNLIQKNKQLPKALKEFNRNLKKFNIKEEMK